MPVEFLGKEIEVKLSEDAARQPLAFKLAGKGHTVAEVLATWQDHAFGAVNPRLRDRKSLHQRIYYRVRTSEGETFEIYGDWLASQRKGRPQKGRWYAYRRITGAPAREAAAVPEQLTEEQAG